MEYTAGDLAKRCGLTVLALHHYETLALLTPSGRSEALLLIVLLGLIVTPIRRINDRPADQTCAALV